MKTPYDAAQRLKRRELDEARQALSVAEARLNETVAAINAAETRVLDEQRIAAENPLIDFGAFAAARRKEIASLAFAMAKLETEIDTLRADLMTRFEALKPLDFASDDYRAAKRAESARRERTKLDEVAARRR